MENIPDERHDPVAWQMQSASSPERYWTMNLTCKQRRGACKHVEVARGRLGVNGKKKTFIAHGETWRDDIGVGVAISTPGHGNRR